MHGRINTFFVPINSMQSFQSPNAHIDCLCRGPESTTKWREKFKIDAFEHRLNLVPRSDTTSEKEEHFAFLERYFSDYLNRIDYLCTVCKIYLYFRK